MGGMLIFYADFSKIFCTGRFDQPIFEFRWSDVLLINEMFHNPEAERLAWVATLALVIHQIISSIWTYLDEHGSLFVARITNLFL